MTYLLDTNACVQYLRGRNSSVLQRLRNTPTQDVHLCSVVKAELLLGALQIAAIALANDQTLVTHNTNEFSRVPHLSIEDSDNP